MPLNKPFQHQPSSIATYAYTDIAEGTGVVNFKGFMAWASGALTARLTTNEPYSNYHPFLASTDSGIQTLISLNSKSDGSQKILNFDLTAFNAPTIVRGTAFVNIPVSGIGEAAGSMTCHLKVSIQNSTTSTTIGYAASGVINFSGTAPQMGILCMPFTLDETQFKKGEVLRVKVDVWGSGTANTQSVAIGHDPQNRDTTYFTAGNDTIMDVFIPFNLDL